MVTLFHAVRAVGGATIPKSLTGTPAMTDRPIIVHSLADAETAIAVATDMGVAVTLRSAPDAGHTLGASVFGDIIAEARRRHGGAPVRAVFDCGEDPGVALGALRHGLEAIRVRAPEKTLARIADIAGQSGTELEDGARDGPVLDLLDADDPEGAVRAWLSAAKEADADVG